jgi:hypothetical protein
MTGTGGRREPSPAEVVPIADAASECGVTVATYISWLNDSGMLLVIPGTEDPMCEWRVFDGIKHHVEDCGCRFVPVPHPDLVELDR